MLLMLEPWQQHTKNLFMTLNIYDMPNQDSPCVPFHQAAQGVHQILCRPARKYSQGITTP